MNITKTQVKKALGITTDTALADFFNVSKQLVGRYPDDKPMPRVRQLELKANHKSLFKKILSQ